MAYITYVSTGMRFLSMTDDTPLNAQMYFYGFPTGADGKVILFPGYVCTSAQAVTQLNSLYMTGNPALINAGLYTSGGVNYFCYSIPSNFINLLISDN